MMFQLFLKPRIPVPLLLLIRYHLAAVRAAIHLALQKYELPIAQLLLFFAVNTSSAQNLIHSRCKPAQRTLRQESRRKRKLFQMIQLHDYLHGNFFSRRKRIRAGYRCAGAVRVLAGFGQMERGGTHGSPSLNRLLLGILAQNASLNQYKTACPTFLSNIGRLRNLLGVAVPCYVP